MPFEPDLALIERRLAAAHQDRTFRPTSPWWSLFSPDELRRLVLPEEGE